MIDENRTTNIKKMFRVLSCVPYCVIYNCVFIDFLCCQYKRLSVICCDKMFSSKSYNELLGIGIPEVLMNLISCNGFMKKKSTAIIL